MRWEAGGETQAGDGGWGWGNLEIKMETGVKNNY